MKKPIKAIALAVLLAAMPVTAFAAGSPNAGNTDYSSNNDSSDDGSSSNSSSSGNSSSSSGTGSSSVVTAGNGTAVNNNGSTPGSTEVPADITVITQSGDKVEVKAATTNNSSGITSGFVDNGSKVTVVTGEAVTEGLPEAVVATINAVNTTGDLSGIQGIDTTGKSAYGNTVTINAEAENLPVSIYVSSLPAGDTVQVAFYNKNTKTWMLIDAVVDHATSIITFTAPTSGTAVVVG
jgi:hypothetical protein